MGDDRFLTTYRKAYVKKQFSPVEPAKFKSDYNDIISGPYTEYILPKFKTPPDYSEETAQQCFERIRETYPITKRYLDKEVDEEKIKQSYKDIGRSVYQVEICKDDYSFVSKAVLARQRQPLPADWGDTPLTTQRVSYRDFRKKFNWNVVPKPCAPPKSHLEPNHKVRNILKVTTGESEYDYNIGKLGRTIIEESLHGKLDEEERNCKLWHKVQLQQAGKPYKLIPPYPVLKW